MATEGRGFEDRASGAQSRDSANARCKTVAVNSRRCDMNDEI